MNHCGECTVCCKVLRVQELGKPAGEWCASVTASGCGRYETRPQSCRNFRCLWLEAQQDQPGHPLFPRWGRPDKSGVMLMVAKLPTGEAAIAAHLRGGRVRSSTEKWLEAIAKQGAPVIRIKGQERKLIWLKRA